MEHGQRKTSKTNNDKASWGKNCWNTELGKIANEYKIIIDGKYISNILKSEWKAEIKNKIVNYLEKTEQNEEKKQGFLQMIIGQRKNMT